MHHINSHWNADFLVYQLTHMTKHIYCLAYISLNVVIICGYNMLSKLVRQKNIIHAFIYSVWHERPFNPSESSFIRPDKVSDSLSLSWLLLTWILESSFHLLTITVAQCSSTAEEHDRVRSSIWLYLYYTVYNILYIYVLLYISITCMHRLLILMGQTPYLGLEPPPLPNHIWDNLFICSLNTHR